MEMENKYASKGVAGTALGLGAGALGVELLRGGLGGIFGSCNTGCTEDHLVNRYEAAQQARIAELETEVKLRDSNIYTDQKLLETYKYFDGGWADEAHCIKEDWRENLAKIISRSHNTRQK